MSVFANVLSFVTRSRQMVRWILLLTVAMLQLAQPQSTTADELYARIRGTVTDKTGATVPEVQITATNTGTHLAKSAVSGPDGGFEILDLPVGTYQVTATKENFKTFSTTDLTLTVNQIYVLTVVLEVGSISEKLIVEASSAQCRSHEHATRRCDYGRHDH